MKRGRVLTISLSLGRWGRVLMVEERKGTNYQPKSGEEGEGVLMVEERKGTNYQPKSGKVGEGANG